MTTHPVDPARRKAVMLTVFVTIFLDLLGFGLIIPVLPFYAESFGARPSVVTWLGSIYSLMQLVFAPFWGRLSDRIGRRPVMLVSVFASVVGYGLLGFAGSLWMLFLARALSGFGNANIATAQAAIADVTPPEDRAKGMGLVGAAFGLGFIFGPAIGGLLGQWGPNAPALFAAGLAIGNLLLAWFILPETRRSDQTPRTGQSGLAALRMASAVRGVPSVLGASLILSCGFSMIEQTLALLMEAVWVVGAPPRGLGLAFGTPEAHRAGAGLTAGFLVVVGLTAAVVQGGVVGRLTPKFGEPRLIFTGFSVLAVGLYLVPILAATAPYQTMFLVAFCLAAGTGLATPSLNSLLSRRSSGEVQGAALGVGQSASALGRVVGPGVSGWLFEVWSGLPFVTGATLMLAGAFSFWRSERRLRVSPSMVP
jgi:multidrug resistance protein